MTLLLCPSNSLSCIDSVSLGRPGVSEKVNSGWPSRLGQSGIRAAAPWITDSGIQGSRCARGSHWVSLQKEGGEITLCKEFCSLASGLHSWPRWSWLNITDAFLFCYWRIKTATWCCHRWICGREARRVSLLVHRHFLILLCHFEELLLIKTSSHSLSHVTRRRGQSV